jgi:hypothetical protein
MPFSFKPEITPGAPDGQTPAPAAFAGSSAANYAAREPLAGKSFVQIALMTIFGLAMLLALGLFGYSFYLSSQIEGKKAALASYESRLGNLPLEDMRKLSNRIKLINQLVKEHPSANVAFRIIEDSVENHITYDRFALNYNESTKAYSLQLSGTAPSYKGVAQQYDTLKRKPYTTYIRDVTISNLGPDDIGNINFSLQMPISIAGLLPEELNLSEGAAERVASSTQEAVVETGTTTPVTGSSTQQQ